MSLGLTLALAPTGAAQDPVEGGEPIVIPAGVVPGAVAPESVEAPVRLIVTEVTRERLAEAVGAHPVDVTSAGPGHQELAATDADLAVLDAAGVEYRVLVHDMKAWLRSRLLQGDELLGQPTAELGAGITPAFGQGEIGGYYSFDEVVSILDQLKVLYPDLITARQSIGQTVEGREIWAVKISDNPDIDENEPEVRFDALHHAREPGGMQATLWFMLWLLENHGSDPLATYLVEEREIWCLPVVNPDGYVYNQANDPQGGGLWRKNRRDNGDGSFGVDLNRNYPFHWGWDDVGSSPDPSNVVYRGPFAASEPEVQAMVAFISSHDFQTVLSIHTYSNIWLQPFGYEPIPPDNSDEYDELGELVTEINGYEYGVSSIILYSTNGSTKDYEEGVHDTMCWTPEIGSLDDNFWPPTERIVSLASENLQALQRTALAAGAYVRLDELALLEVGDGDAAFEAGETVQVVAGVRNSGRGATGTTVVGSLTSGSASGIVGVGGFDFGVVGGFTSTDNAAAPFTIAIAPGTPGGTRIPFTLVLSAEGHDVVTQASFITGSRRPVVSDAVETDVGWIVGSPEDNATTGVWELGDPVGTTYEGEPSNPEDDASALGVRAFITGNGGGSGGTDDVDGGPTTLTSPVLDLSGIGSAVVSYSRWFGNGASAVRDVDDFFEVWISNDDGDNWVSVERVGHPANAWTQRSFNVEDLLPQTASMRMRFVTGDEPNNAIVEGGVDDLRVDVYSDVPAAMVYGRAALDTPVRFNLSGSDGDAYAWFMSAFPGFLDIPEIVGPLLIDVGTLTGFVSGIVPAVGLSTHELTIPNEPAIVGATVYFQVLVNRAGQLYLTNRDDLTVE